MSGGLPRHFRSIDEVREAVGDPIGVSPPRVVTQEMIDVFADITGDHEWLHVDRERAASGPFGGTIAHGYLTLSLVAGFAAEVFRLEIDEATVNYGLDRVRFPSPLLTGSSVSAEVSFTAVQEHPAGHTIGVRYVLRADGSERPVCIADALLLALSTPL